MVENAVLLETDVSGAAVTQRVIMVMSCTAGARTEGDVDVA